MIESMQYKRLTANITYTQEGVSCFVGQERAKFEIQFFVGKFSGKNPCLRIAENRCG